ncbi:MAG: HDIG domain-containing protein, partial [Anaerolineae bacterium]|nr:HDIG domain-containing protein [Anaerolineae bacterium]
VQLAQSILDYIRNIRADIYGTQEQRVQDLAAISSLSLEPELLGLILQLDDETWDTMEDETINVLARVMREEIREGEEDNQLRRLAAQVNPDFNSRQRDLIAAIVADLIRPNTFANDDLTAETQAARVAEVEPAEINYASGELIVSQGQVVTDLIYEALVNLNLLNPEENRPQEVLRALVASTLVLILGGVYLLRFSETLLRREPGKLFLIAALFLAMLALGRFLESSTDNSQNIILFPAAALALLYVSTAGMHPAIIGTLGLAFLTGLMSGDDLQVTILVAVGGIVGALTLRRAERLNSYFVSGLFIGLSNLFVLLIFNIVATSALISGTELPFALLETFVSGAVLVPATAVAIMYVVTALFNLPTALKLLDLSQSNKALLQRLQREAPGTYQHSLEVANLAERAASAIGGDAQLTHVAGLYHDIGKMLNPLYFTENQQYAGNPHDSLNDPYRSADIIISHVTEGDEMARQYRLPNRIRDFIREHHGTTQVFVFYQRALNQASGDTDSIDIADFTYPGPRPRSKETAILMLSDSCEAAVRSANPQSKGEIAEVVDRIINGKRDSGQLDESGLTLQDLYTIRESFVEFLQGMFHPRINYRDAVGNKAEPAPPTPSSTPAAPATASAIPTATNEQSAVVSTGTSEVPAAAANKTRQVPSIDEDDDDPLTEVPRLPRLDERRNTVRDEAEIAAVESEEESEES